MTARAWCFTVNNPKSDEYQFPECVRYAIWQREKGEEKATEHHQGYIEFRSPVRLSKCKTIIHSAHWERRRGTRDEAIRYCEKEDTRIGGPWEHGDRGSGGAGRRNDLRRLKRAMDDGLSEKDIATDDDLFEMWARYPRIYERYNRLKTGNRNWKTKVHVYLGIPGCGKSKAVMDLAPNAYWKQRSQWWDGLEGNKQVVLDDYYGWLPYDTLLRICDRYPLMVETKGGQCNFLANKH